MRLPGTHLLLLARRVLDAATVDRVIEPAIADLQHEWEESADSPVTTRLLIRVRAYSAIVRVVGLQIFKSVAYAGLTPPPWPLVGRLLGFTLVTLATTAVFRVFFSAFDDADDQWLLGLPDWILSQAVFLPFVWPTLFAHRNNPRDTQQRAAHRASASGRHHHDVPPIGASGFAKVAAVYWILCVCWTGWIAPLLRQQYLIGIGDSASATSPHQWMLSTLIAAASADASGSMLGEIHQRLIRTASIPIATVLSWAAIRRYRRVPANTVFAAHLARAVVVAIIGLMAAQACESSLGNIASQWLGYLVAGVGAVAISIALRIKEHTPHEADA